MPRPFTVGVSDLLRQPGTRRPVPLSVRLDGLAVTDTRVDPDRDVEADLVLESVSVELTGGGHTGIAVTGTLTVPWVGACRRCLEPVVGEAGAEVEEVYERRADPGEGPDTADTYAFADDLVDLEPMVRDATLLALPLAPLCSDDCRGPDPDAFPARPAEDPVEAGEVPSSPPPDPRWAALDQLRFD